MILAEIKKIVKEFDPKLDQSSDTFKVAVILLTAALVTGPNTVRVRKFTGYKSKFVDQTAHYFRRNKMWIGGNKPRLVTEDWCDEELGTVNFWVDVLVGLGQVRITSQSDTGVPHRTYAIATTGERRGTTA